MSKHLNQSGPFFVVTHTNLADTRIIILASCDIRSQFEVLQFFVGGRVLTSIFTGGQPAAVKHFNFRAESTFPVPDTQQD